MPMAFRLWSSKVVVIQWRDKMEVGWEVEFKISWKWSDGASIVWKNGCSCMNRKIGCFNVSLYSFHGGEVIEFVASYLSCIFWMNLISRLLADHNFSPWLDMILLSSLLFDIRTFFMCSDCVPLWSWEI